MNSWAEKKKPVSLSSPSNSFDGMMTAALLINLPDEAQRGGCRFFLRRLKARIVNHLLEMLEDDAALFVRQLHPDFPDARRVAREQPPPYFFQFGFDAGHRPSPRDAVRPYYLSVRRPTLSPHRRRASAPRRS